MTSGSGLRLVLAANCALSILSVTAWHAVRVATSSPAPTVKIQWKEAVSESERQRLEQVFQLVNAEKIGERSYNYDLIDSRAPVIKAIVEHPAVESTADLDPGRFTIATTTEPGDTIRWAWHRRARDATARKVSVVLHSWLVASVAFVGMTRYAESRDAAKRMSAQTLPR